MMFCISAGFTLVDIGTDTKLAHEYWDKSNTGIYNVTSSPLDPTTSAVYGLLTTTWIALGGLIQFLLIAFFLHRGDDRLKWLPKSIRILLLLCSPILLGPVVVNAYGAFFVLRHADNDEIQNDILRFETSMLTDIVSRRQTNKISYQLNNLLQLFYFFFRLFHCGNISVNTCRVI